MIYDEKTIKEDTIASSMEALPIVIKALSNCSKEAFICTIGTVIDEYASSHDIPCMQLHGAIYDVAKLVFEEIGEFR